MQALYGTIACRTTPAFATSLSVRAFCTKLVPRDFRWSSKGSPESGLLRQAQHERSGEVVSYCYAQNIRGNTSADVASQAHLRLELRASLKNAASARISSLVKPVASGFIGPLRSASMISLSSKLASSFRSGAPGVAGSWQPLQR